MAKRIQRKRSKGWRMPPNARYVGRPTKWGNPFPVGHVVDGGYLRDHSLPEMIMDAERSIEIYQMWLLGEVCAGRLDVRELRHRDLACWCPLDKPCHADVLIALAAG